MHRTDLEEQPMPRSITSVATVLAAVALLAPAAPARAADGIRDVPVTFDITNTADTDGRCATDMAAYRLRGTLVTPAGAHHTRAPSPRAVTVLLHGFGVPGSTFRPAAVAGYDVAAALARLGHAVVVLDQLGWGASDIPHGFFVCTGAWADHAWQVARALRSGGYTAGGARGPAFDRVALAGFSIGGGVAEIAAGRDAADALVVMASPGSSEASDELGTIALEIATPCFTGGLEKRPGAPAGYQRTFLGTHADLYVHDAEPALLAELVAHEERGPCGVGGAVAQEAVARELARRRIDVPVLVVQGAHDRLFVPGSGPRAAAAFVASPDVTYVEMAGSGHVLTIEREAPVLHGRLHAWLSDRGF
jgi:pimeloyl-ACP methyl ester carboxylesterase